MMRAYCAVVSASKFVLGRVDEGDVRTVVTADNHSGCVKFGFSKRSQG